MSLSLDSLFAVKGKVALVTGGTRGIGLMIARGFVENGVKTYIASRGKEACEKVSAELSKLGTCIGIPADLSTSEGVAALAAEIAAREGKLHILVNNAGATWGAPLEEFPESGWDKVMDLNVRSMFFLTQKLMKQLDAASSKEDPARVINIGSIDGLHASQLETYSYAAAKAAVHHLTRHLAKHVARRNITVNAIAPGPFESKMMAGTLAAMGDQIRASNPRGRIGEPADMAGVAIYLASKAGAYVTGAVIPVDGGISQTL